MKQLLLSLGLALLIGCSVEPADGPAAIETNTAALSPGAGCGFADAPTDANGCYDFTLRSSKSRSPSVRYNGAYCLCRPMPFRIPELISVTQASPDSDKADLFFVDADSMELVTCRYRSPTGHHDDHGHDGHDDEHDDHHHSCQHHPQVQADHYDFWYCSNGAREGDRVEARYVELSILNGDAQAPLTAAEVSLSEISSACATDNSAPTLTITAPASNAKIYAPSLWVEGEVHDQGVTAVDVNNLPAIVVGDRFLAGPIPIQVGSNSLLVRAEDVRAQQSLLSRSVLGQAGTPPVPSDVPNQNQAPLFLNSPANRIVTAGATFSFDAIAADPDAGDKLSYSVAHHTCRGGGPSINPSTGRFSFRPAKDDVGFQDFSIRVTDKKGKSAELGFRLYVASPNRAPSFVGPAPLLLATAGTLYQYDFNASDPDVHDTLAFSLVRGPTGMRVSSGSGLLSFTPGPTQVGPHAVTVLVSDRAGGCSSFNFTLVVQPTTPGNLPPLIVSTPITSALEDAAYSYAVVASDPNAGDTLSYSLTTAPAGMTIQSASGLITWTPDNDDVGPHPVSVRVSDQGGLFAVQSYTLSVANVNDSPFITSTPITDATVGALYEYNLVVDDPDPGELLSYSVVTGPAGLSIDRLGLVSWVPSAAQAGDRPVTLRVTDSAGVSVDQSYTITVISPNTPPLIVSTPPSTAAQDQLYRYDVIATDAPGDVLSFALTQAPLGMSIDALSGRIEWTPGNDQVGPNPVTVRVSDQGGAFDSQSFVLVVANVNDAPVISSTPVTSATEDLPYLYSVTATDPDVGETLIFSLDVAPSGMSIDPASGQIHWTPTNADVGAQQVSARVTDSAGASASQSFAVVVSNANDAPHITSTPPTGATVGAPYSYLVVASDPDVGEVLSFALQGAPDGMAISGNRIDWTPSADQAGPQAVVVRVQDADGAFDSQSFTIIVLLENRAPLITSSSVAAAAEHQPFSFTVTASDPDTGDELSFALDSAPNGMTIAAQSGQISWTPSSAQVGMQLTSVRVTDRGGLSAVGQLRITVANVNDPPTIESTPRTDANEDELYIYAVDARDPDPGDVLAYSLTAAPSGMVIDASGVIRWTPSQAQVGSAAVTVLVFDGQLTASQSFTIFVVNTNDAPTIVSDPPTSGRQHELYSYEPEIEDEDTGDVHTYSLLLAPSGMTIGARTGTIGWTPDEAQSGDFQVRLRVSDQAGASDSQSFTITVEDVNDAPSFVSTPRTSAVERSLYAHRLEARDPDTNDTRVFSLDVAPPGMGVDPVAGVIEWTPSSNQLGPSPVTARVTDAVGLSATQSFVITVANVNDAPTFVSAPTTTAIQGQPYSYLPSVVDPDPGEVLAYALELAPQGMSVNPATGRLSWTPTSSQVGGFDVSLVVRDAAGARDVQMFMLGVANVNDAPVFDSTPLTAALERQAYRYLAHTIDPDGDSVRYTVRIGPAGLTVAALTGELSWVPNTSQVGTHQVFLRATDPDGAFNEQSWLINVSANGAPCASGDLSARCSALAWSHTLGSDSVPLGAVLIDESGPAGTRVFSSDPFSGLAALGGGPDGTYEWTFQTGGHVPVTARAELSSASVVWVGIPRLAPLTDLAGPLPIAGTSFDDVNGRIDLSFPPGAVAFPATLSAAILDGQSLPGALPHGYSPVRAIWYEVAGLVQTPPTATFTLPAPLPANTRLLLAAWDESAHVWIAEANVLSSATPGVLDIAVELSLPGGYALLLPDAELSTIPLGQPLLASPLQAPALDALTGSGEVKPAVQIFSLRPEDVTAKANVRVTYTQPVPSGLVLPARLYETYTLAKGSSEVPAIDLTVACYRYPPREGAPALGEPTVLAASFDVRPRYLLGGDGVKSILQRIDVQASLQIAALPIDANGGSIASGGVLLSVPPSTFSEPTLVSLTPIPTDTLPVTGASADRAFRVDWSGGDLPLGTRLSVESTVLLPNKHYVLARREVNVLRSTWVPVERFHSDAMGILTRLEPAGPDALPGLNVAGTYAFFAFAAAQGVVRGNVEDGTGAPLSGVIVSVGATPWAFITHSSGRFTLLGVPGPIDVSAERPASSALGGATGTLASATSVLELVIVLGQGAPRLVRSSPKANALGVSLLQPIEAFFSEPLATSSFQSDTALTLETSAGASVPGTATLRPDRSSIQFLPTNPLAPDTLFSARLSSALTDTDGLTLTGSTSFSFRTAPTPGRPTAGPRFISYAPGSQRTPCAPYTLSTIPNGLEPLEFDPTGLTVGVPGFDPNDPTITCVVGGAGVADPDVPVILVNEETGATTTVLSTGNGAFKSYIRGAETDLLSAAFVNQNGTRIQVPLELQRFDDGSVALYASGGTVECPNPFGDGPMQVEIDPGSIPVRAKIKLEPRTRDQALALLGGQDSLDGQVMLGVAVRYEGPRTTKPVHLRFPVDRSNLPADPPPEEAGFVIARPLMVQLEGEDIPVYETIDVATYENGAIVTHSEFSLGGLFDLFATPSFNQNTSTYMAIWSNTRPTFVSGYVVGCQIERDASGAITGCDRFAHLPPTFPGGRKLPGALVVATPSETLGTSAIGRVRAGASVSLADEAGRYTVSAPFLGSASYVGSARHPEFPLQTASGAISADLTNISAGLGGWANLFFDTRVMEGPFAGGPSLSVASSPARPGLYDPVLSTEPPGVDERALLRITAEHPTSPPTSIQVSLDQIVGLTPAGAVAADLTGLAAPSDAPPLSNNRLTRSYLVTCRVPALVRLRIETENAQGKTTLLYAISFVGTPPPPPSEDPLPEPNDTTGPHVLSTWPSEGGLIPPATAILLTFNEPIARDILADPSPIQIFPPAGPPALRLSLDGQALEVGYAALQPNASYRLTVGAGIRDRSANDFDQAGGSFSLNFRTSPIQSTSSGSLPGLQMGGAAVIYGAHAFVGDRTAGVIRIYDLSDPSAPVAGGAIVVPGGAPRDLELIPHYSFVRATGAASQQPCRGPFGNPPEVSWTQGLPAGSSLPGCDPIKACASLDRTLLAVTGGLAGITALPGQSEVSATVGTPGRCQTQPADCAVGATGQFLTLLDVTTAQSALEVTHTRLTVDETAVTTNLRWSPPALAYLESSALIPKVNVLNLQTFLFGLDLSKGQYAAMPSTFLGSPGVDLNADGDYVDPSEVLPLPGQPSDFLALDPADRCDNRALLRGFVDLGFAGKQLVAFAQHSTQAINDYAFSGRSYFVGAALSSGFGLLESGPNEGEVDTNHLLQPAYRTLASNRLVLGPNQQLMGAFEFTTPFPIQSAGDWKLAGSARPTAIGYFPALPLRVRTSTEGNDAFAGEDRIVDLVIVAVNRSFSWVLNPVPPNPPGPVPAQPPPTPPPETRLYLIDVSNVLDKKLLGQVLLPAGIGDVKHIELDPLMPTRLRVGASQDLVWLDIFRLTMTGSGLGHPSVIGSVRGVGGPQSGDGTSSFGVFVRPSEGQVVFTGPQISLVSFPEESGLLSPSALLTLAEGPRSERVRDAFSRMQRELSFRLALVRATAGESSELEPPNLDRHFYVMVQAPGGAGTEVPLLLQTTNDAGEPLRSHTQGFAPALAATPDTVSRAKLTPPTGGNPVQPLLAHRLSADPNNELYNVYLSDPFALVAQEVSAADLTALRTSNGQPRQIFHSTRGVRVSIDPAIPSSSILAPFASKIDSTARIQLGTAISASAYDARRILGPNPNPVRTAFRAPGTNGHVAIHSGELVADALDLELPSPQIPLRFARHYRSQDRHDGALGAGWDYDYNQHVVWADPEHIRPGTSVPHIDRGGSNDSKVRSGEVTFDNGAGDQIDFKQATETAPAEVIHDPLVIQIGRKNQVARWYLPPAGVFDVIARLDTGAFVRLTPDGMQYWYGPTGRLEKIFHRYEQNRHELEYNTRGELRRINDKSVPQTRYLELGYYRTGGDPLFEQGLDEVAPLAAAIGLIARVRAQIGSDASKDVLYHYDGAQHLVSVETVRVRSPRLGGFAGRKLIEYIWGAGGRITGIVDGSLAAEPEFAASTVATDGAISAGGGYRGNVSANLGQPNLAKSLAAGGSSSFVTSDGTTHRYELNAFGLASSQTVTDASGRAETSTFEYEDGIQLNKIIFPKGNSLTIQYDTANENVRSRGNILRITRTPGGAGTPLFRTFNYHPLYNLPQDIQTDFEGNGIEVILSSDFRDVERVRYPSGFDETIDHYADTGLIAGRSDPNGVTVSFAYEQGTGFPSEAQQGNVLTRYFYDNCAGGERGRPCRIEHAQSLPERFEYDELDRVILESKGGLSVSYGRDHNGNPTQIDRVVDASRTLHDRRVFDQQGFLTSRTLDAVETDDPVQVQSLTWLFEADSLRRVKKATAPTGEETVYEYDARGRVLSETTGDFVVNHSYDKNGNEILTKVGPDALTVRSFDGYDRLVQESDPALATTSYDYNANDHLIGVESSDLHFGTLREDRVTSIDEFGRPKEWTASTGAGVARSSASYATRSSVVTGARGAIATETIDSSGRPSQTRVRAGSATLLDSTRLYDLEGQPAGILALEGGGQDFGQSFEYDNLKHLTRVDDARSAPLFSQVSRLDGAVLSLTRSPGVGGLKLTSETPRSVLGESLGINTALGVSTVAALDGDRRPHFVGADPSKGRRFTYEHNSGRLVQVEERDGSLYRFADFDARNLPRAITIPGGSMTLGYSPRGELTSQAVTFGTGPSVTQSFSYDGLGRLRSASDTPGISFDARYTPLGMDQGTLHVGANSAVFGYQLDDNGDPQSLTYPSGARVIEQRDAAGRLLSATVQNADPIVQVDSYAMALTPGSVKIGRAGQTQIQRNDIYDHRRRLLARSYTIGAERVAELRYAYDDADRELARQSLHKGGRVDFFEYDLNSRLLRAELDARPPVHDVSAPPWLLMDGASAFGAWRAGEYGRRFTFDMAGEDRVLATHTDQGPGAIVPTVAGGMPSIGALGQTTHTDGFPREWDALGNITHLQLESGPAYLVYDGLRRLRQLVRQDGSTITYDWRADGPLARRVVTCAASAINCAPSNRIYVYDGLLLLEEIETLPTPHPVARYYYADEGDTPIAADMGPGMARRYFVTDRMGSVIEVLNEEGAPLERISYDPWTRPSFEPADTTEPVVSSIVQDANGQLTVVFTEPVLPAPIVASATGIVDTFVELNTAVALRDASGASIGVTVRLDDTAPAHDRGTVYRITPASPLLAGIQYTLTIPQAALQDRWAHSNRLINHQFAGGLGPRYTGPPEGSTRTFPSAQSGTDTHVLFQSHLYDPEAGLYLMRARVFDPFTAQFLQLDPAAYRDGPNLYAGFKNDLVNVRDPTGAATDAEVATARGRSDLALQQKFARLRGGIAFNKQHGLDPYRDLFFLQSAIGASVLAAFYTPGAWVKWGFPFGGLLALQNDVNADITPFVALGLGELGAMALGAGAEALASYSESRFLATLESVEAQGGRLSIVESIPTTAPITDPSRLLAATNPRGPANAIRGNAFERDVRGALRAGPKSGGFSEVASKVTTVPDLPLEARFGVTDVKDVIRISRTRQLRAQLAGARTGGNPFNLVISPRTRFVSRTLQRDIASTEGRIFEFDPATETFSNVSLSGSRVIR